MDGEGCEGSGESLGGRLMGTVQGLEVQEGKELIELVQEETQSTGLQATGGNSLASFCCETRGRGEAGCGGACGEGEWATELYSPDSLYFFSEVGGRTIC